MNKSVIRHLIAIAGVSASCLLQAQTFPSKPVTILVGTGAGGNPDTIARVFKAQVDRKWKQTVIVDNRTGAGGAIALRALAQSAPDGHTLMSGASATHGLFFKDPGFRFEDLTPAAVVGVSLYGLLVSKSLNVKTLNEFVAWAKANPAKLNFGVIPSTSHEIEVSNIQNMLGLKGTPVPYKGMPEVYTGLISGELQASIHSNSPQVKSGQVIPLVFGGQQRQPDHPSVPTFKELGFDYHPGANFIFYARAGSPVASLNAVAAEVADMVKGSEFQEKIARPLGITGLGLSHDASVKHVNDEYERVRAGVQRLGIKPQ